MAESAATLFALAQVAYNVSTTIYTFIKNGEKCNELVEDLAKKLWTFSDLLRAVSRAVRRIELSNALRQERPPELSLIRSSIEHSRKAMRTLVTCLGKLGIPKSYSALKKAIQYWCYEHDGKSIVDKALKDIDDQISVMSIAFQCVCAHITVDVHDALIPSGKSTNEQESQQESFASTTSANSIDRDKVGIDDSQGWDFEALLGPEISAHRGSASVTASLYPTLVRSIRDRDLESLCIQIVSGADILAQDSDGWCALHHGAHAGSGKILGILLESEQVKGKAEHINKADNTGATPLHIAVLRGKEALARQLLEAGADKDALDHFDRSPLFRAVEKNRENLVELLLDYKAKPTFNLLDTKARKTPNLPKRFLEMKSAIKQRKRRR